MFLLWMLLGFYNKCIQGTGNFLRAVCGVIIFFLIRIELEKKRLIHLFQIIKS